MINIVKSVLQFIQISLKMPDTYYLAAAGAALVVGLVTRKWRWALLAGYVVILFSSMVLTRNPYRTAKFILEPTVLHTKIPKLTSEKIANVIAFIPIGFLVGKKWWGLFIGIGFSVLIECLQLKLRLGYFEADDLLCNTAGTLISVLLTQLFLLVTGKRRRKNVWNFRYDYTD